MQNSMIYILVPAFPSTSVEIALTIVACAGLDYRSRKRTVGLGSAHSYQFPSVMVMISEPQVLRN